MNTSTTSSKINWRCKHTWKKTAKNTAWCLLGCAIGDNATIILFQLYAPHTAMWLIMLTASVMGLLSSITLETVILSRQLPLKDAFKVAIGMSFISMLMMETTANLASILFAGGNRLVLHWWSIIPSWTIGYLSAWVYNYYKMKKHGKACH